MRKLLHKVIIISFIILPFTITNAQSIGFGCFGFVSGYGGYSYQSFEPGILRYYGNELLTPVDLVNNQYFDEFNKVQGFRVGLNFFRAKFSSFFLTAKGYYQILSNKKNIVVSDIYSSVDYDLSFKSWGLGIDVGIPLTKIFNWKIVDGELIFNSVKFKQTINDIGFTAVTTYKNDSPDLGYSIGTGFIVYLIEGYLSLEGTAGYTFMKIEKVMAEDGFVFLNGFYSSDEQNFIKSGGFSAVIQLNVGFPL